MSLYFRAFHALFGTQPAAYHAFSLALHVGTGLLLYRVLARGLAPGVAAAAAAVFLTSPALFDALHWISGVADLMSVACLALAVWLLAKGAGSRARAWLAVAAYALALASKEIAVGAAPVMIVLHLRQGGRAGWARAGLVVSLAALFALPASGAWQTGAGEPYALDPAAALLNLPAFAAAATLGGVAYAEPSDLAWARLPWVRVAGWGILAAWLLVLVARRSSAAVEARALSRLRLAPLPTDFVLRRAVIARNAIGDLAAARERLRPGS